MEKDCDRSNLVRTRLIIRYHHRYPKRMMRQVHLVVGCAFEPLVSLYAWATCNRKVSVFAKEKKCTLMTSRYVFSLV